MTLYDKASIISVTLILGEPVTASLTADVSSVFFNGLQTSHRIAGLHE
jgi:hypothetical protein